LINMFVVFLNDWGHFLSAMCSLRNMRWWLGKIWAENNGRNSVRSGCTRSLRTDRPFPPTPCIPPSAERASHQWPQTPHPKTWHIMMARRESKLITKGFSTVALKTDQPIIKTQN
jgi:hypothetical protein